MQTHLASWAIVESLPGVLYLYDRHGRFLKWNTNFEKASGYSHDEISRMRPKDFFHSQDHERLEARIAEVFAAGASSIEANLLAKDRSLKPYLFTGLRIEVDGETCVVGMGVDISERVAAEEAARHLAEQVTRTLASISDGLCTIDRRWRFTFVNREAERQLSRTSETLIGRDIWEEYPQMLGTVFETSYRQAMATQQMVEFEAWFEPLASWFSVRAYPSDEGLAVYFHNVTQQRQAREAARISEERFRLLARATNDAIWDWDLVAGSRWWNEGFKTLFGYSPDDAASDAEAWSTHVHPQDRQRVVDGINKAITGTGDSWTDEYRFLRHDGSTAHVLDRGYIIRASDGTPTRMIGGITDLTERKKLEAQFLRAQRLESIGTLAGGIAHDLNNILAPITMSVGLLKLDERAPDRVRLLDTIEASGRRGAEMVRQVLGFARGIEGERVSVNLRHVCREVQKILRQTMPRNIDVECMLPSDLWWITADATQIHQVLMNLCVNARDAMPNGGRLRLEVANVTLDEVYSSMTSSLSPGPYVLITADDSGIGMDRDTLERIFEPFFTTKEVGKGTGLGLSTVLTIVKSHGGAVEVASEPGVGTTFKVYLPAAASGTPTASPDAVDVPRGNGELVLVVDDEENIRLLARKTLERYGYTVLDARHGAEAVALYAQHRDVALVITDMAMPVMDGLATILALKSVNADVRIIASSGHGEKETKARAIGAGVSLFVPKPYTADELVSVVHHALHADGAQAVTQC